jgi:solute carrier family 45, member 1/2/4
MAWFPIIFYSTLYVGDLYKRSLPAATTDEEQFLIDAEATRSASRALFYSALLTLSSNLILPTFVLEAAEHPSQNHIIRESLPWWKRICHMPRGMQVHLVTMWPISHLVFAVCMFATLYVTPSRTLFIVY